MSESVSVVFISIFQEAVIRNDVMVDKLIIKDVQLTAANDDNYFVFEDFILQVKKLVSSG